MRRAVTLGLPVCSLGQTAGTEGILDDYRNITRQIMKHDPAAIAAAAGT